MAGVPSIPPLLCNTPPPIDFGEDGDDSGLPPMLAFEEDDDEFGDFALADTNEDARNADAMSLPHTPLQFEQNSPVSDCTDIPSSLERDCIELSTLPPVLKQLHAQEQTIMKAQPVEAFNYEVTTFTSDKHHAQTTRLINRIGDLDYVSVAEDSPNDNNLIAISNDAKQPETTYNTQVKSELSAEDVISVSYNQKERRKNFDILKEEIESVRNLPIGLVTQSAPPFSDLVLLEDVTDDSSDDECYRSPQKCATSPTYQPDGIADNNSEDFFTIRVVPSPPVAFQSNEYEKASIANETIMSNITRNNNYVEKSDIIGVDRFDADFGDFADFESHAEYAKSEPSTLVTSGEAVAHIVNNTENLWPTDEQRTNNSPIVDDDFDDFQDFCSAPMEITAAAPIISTPNPLEVKTPTIDTITNCVESNEKSAIVLKMESESTSIEDDDDDFGDFEAASFVTPIAPDTNHPHSVVQHSQKSTTNPLNKSIANGNLTERLNSVLNMMFPTKNDNDSDEVKADTIKTCAHTSTNLQSQRSTLPFESIETAKALEFQWPQSEIRHALIRSIGIDSRNILFGENWNPSMPRFAANLSFNPLKPIKPQVATALTSSSGTSFADADAMHYGNGSTVDMSCYAVKTDVPEVEFDWQGAGLVNPLDGLAGEANPRETEAIHSSPAITRLDSPDDQQQSHTTFTNIGDKFSENLSDNDTEVTVPSMQDICPAHIPLDSTYQLAIQEQAANNTSSCSNPYTNGKPINQLHLGGNIDDDGGDDETVATSTYAGPLKETHIYTPSKTDTTLTGKPPKAAAGTSEPIDFDYEIAAAGIIIDEKVVKKEYRDVEYNPGFSLEVVNEYVGVLTNELSTDSVSQQQPSADFDPDEFTEFTEFQSMPPPPISLQQQPTSVMTYPTFGATTPVSKTTYASQMEPTTSPRTISPHALPTAVAKTKEAANTLSRTNSPPVTDNMILSPAILLPQAIPISANNTAPTPTIQWGNSTTSINPDELARIEELFPQPKVTTAKEVNSSQKSSPTHIYSEKQAQNSSLSISASVARKEQDSTLNDDYWSDFVSVPVTKQVSSNSSKTNNNNSIRKNINNNHLAITPKHVIIVNANTASNINRNREMLSPRQQQHMNAMRIPTQQRKTTAHTTTHSDSNSNDDDWSDYVSSTPTPTSTSHATTHTISHATYANSCTSATHAPQFNSAAWQHANFYNNPLGLYHQQTNNQMRTATSTTHDQQIHMMQDFSTVPRARPHVVGVVNSNNAHVRHMQHSSSHLMQVGNARIAPSISLIPDLGFVAPAMPVHTAFVNVLPKTSYSKK